MGNPAWGHGFHAGLAKGRSQGALVAAGVTAVLAAANFAVTRLRERREADEQARLSSETSSVDSVHDEQGHTPASNDE